MSRNGASNHQVSEPSGGSLSVALVSPTVRDTVQEIADKLGEVEGIIDGLDREDGTGKAGHVPNMKDLTEEISKLSKHVKEVKLEQENQIKVIRNSIKEGAKEQVLQLAGEKIRDLISDAVVAQVKKRMEQWGNRPEVGKLVGALHGVADENDILLKRANFNLENSRSRHQNSSLDVEDDSSIGLKAIKRQDGHVSENFPTNLRHLFSYDEKQLVRLIEEYELRPLEKHAENLNRFLVFIGIRTLNLL